MHRGAQARGANQPSTGGVTFRACVHGLRVAAWSPFTANLCRYVCGVYTREGQGLFSDASSTGQRLTAWARSVGKEGQRAGFQHRDGGPTTTSVLCPTATPTLPQSKPSKHLQAQCTAYMHQGARARGANQPSTGGVTCHEGTNFEGGTRSPSPALSCVRTRLTRGCMVTVHRELVVGMCVECTHGRGRDCGCQGNKSWEEPRMARHPHIFQNCHPTNNTKPQSNHPPLTLSNNGDGREQGAVWEWARGKELLGKQESASPNCHGSWA